MQRLQHPAGLIRAVVAIGLGLAAVAGHATAEDAAKGAGESAARNGAAAAPDKITIGAIRWDAWFDDKANPYAKNLADKQWHGRLPFYAKVISDSEVEIHGDNQEAADKEIAYAKAGGIDYFAFMYYWKGRAADGFEMDKFNAARRLYLKSMHKGDVNFCLVVYPQPIEEHVREWVELMQEPNYQKVAGGRPLLYLMFWNNNEAPENVFGSMDKARAFIDGLRKRIVDSGQKNPYLVAMRPSPEAAAATVTALGLDAIGTYTSFGGPDYAGLSKAVGTWWERMKKTGSKVVPNVTAGWGGPRDKLGDTQQPTPELLAAHVRSAFAWIDANPDAAEARTMLFYAWNENDEGGWLVPDKGQGTAKLDAIRGVVDERDRRGR